MYLMGDKLHIMSRGNINHWIISPLNNRLSSRHVEVTYKLLILSSDFQALSYLPHLS